MGHWDLPPPRLYGRGLPSLVSSFSWELKASTHVSSFLLLSPHRAGPPRWQTKKISAKMPALHPTQATSVFLHRPPVQNIGVNYLGGLTAYHIQVSYNEVARDTELVCCFSSLQVTKRSGLPPTDQSGFRIQ